MQEMNSSRIRQELVGKRFLYVPSDPEATPATRSSSTRGGGDEGSTSRGGHVPTLKLSRIADWNWISGVIRCANTVEENDQELQVREIWKLVRIRNLNVSSIFIEFLVLKM